MFIGLGLYNIFLHPLHRYPGPKLWAAYWIPYTASNMQGRLPFKILEFHHKYGPVVRIAPNHLVFADSDAWNDIYGLQAGRVQNRKDFYCYLPLEPGDEGELLHANDAMHTRLRRIYGPAFTPKAVEEQSKMLGQYSNSLVSQLKTAILKDPVQDMSAWYNFTTFDLTGDFAFGENFHCLDRGGEYHFFIKTIFNGVVIGLRMMQLERYYLYSLVKPLIPKSALKPKDDMESYTKELVDRRLSRGADPNTTDVFNYLLKNKNKEDQLTRDELRRNGLTLVVAGSETVATLLTGTTWFLCKNRDKLLKVQQEVRSVFKVDSEITVKSVNKLPYMLAVLSEGLRVFPPAPFAVARIISTKGGQTVAGYYAPENVSFYI